MVFVVVRGDQVVDVPKLGDLCGDVDNAIGISTTGISRIDQNRLACGRDHQRRSTSLNVDPINVEATIFLTGKSLPAPTQDAEGKTE